MAQLASFPEFALDHEEAKDLAGAYAELATHYPSLLLPAKTSAITNFGAQLTMIYGTRLAIWRMKRAMNAPTPAPRQAPQQPPMPQPSPVMQAPSGINGASAPNQQPPMETREVPPEMRRAEIPGVGAIEFPEDHPLAGGRKPN